MEKRVLNEWIAFKQEIMYKNRYFFKHNIVSTLLRLKDVRMFPDNTKMDFFRAREGRHSQKDISEMLNPPIGKATAGRCNPEGISYLYLATDESTAIKEIRPSKNEVTIARFSVDVSRIFSFLPYKFSYMNEFIVDSEVDTLIRIINAEMGRIIEEDNKIQYIPLQFVAEYIKNMGYDGFVYSSVVGEGINLVMFESDKATIIERYEKCI